MQCICALKYGILKEFYAGEIIRTLALIGNGKQENAMQQEAFEMLEYSVLLDFLRNYSVEYYHRPRLPDPSVLTRKSYNLWRDCFVEDPAENLQPVQQLFSEAKKVEQTGNNGMALQLFMEAFRCLKEIIKTQLISKS